MITNIAQAILKKNAIKLAKHHKKYCEGEQCDISLLMLAELLSNAGIKLTDKDMRHFI